MHTLGARGLHAPDGRPNVDKTSGQHEAKGFWDGERVDLWHSGYKMH